MKNWHYQPAADHGMPPGRRLRSTRRESGYLSAIASRITLGLAAFYLLQRHHLRIYGAQHLPSRPPFILAANHNSHLDLFVLAASLPPPWRSRIYPVSAGDTFFASTVSSWLAAFFLNALPLWRKSGATHALDDLRQRVTSHDDILVLFPEGTRSRTGILSPFKPGIGRLTAATATPILPCAIHGTHQSLPPRSRWPRPGTITLRIGNPIQTQSVSNDKSGWRHIAQTTESAIRALLQHESMP